MFVDFNHRNDSTLSSPTQLLHSGTTLFKLAINSGAETTSFITQALLLGYFIVENL